MSYKDIRTRYALLAKIVILLAVLGLSMFIFANIGEDPSHVTFSLIAFVISVAALLLTTLQSTTIARQMQMTERAAREVRETGEQIKDLIGRDKRLASEIHQDIELDREIIAALEAHGVGENERERRDVAKRIALHLKSATKKHK